MEILFFRTSNGQFSVFVNGEDSGYRIVNGSLGVSGKGRNEYGFYKIIAGVAGRPVWSGSLQNAKKNIKYLLEKNK